MERSQSRFSEVAQKAKQKRTELDEAAAAREANRIRLEDEADAKRALEFAYELKRLRTDPGTGTIDNAITDSIEEPGEDVVEDGLEIEFGEAYLDDYYEVRAEPTAEELSRIEAEALGEARARRIVKTFKAD